MRTERAAKALTNRWNNTQAGNRESQRVPPREEAPLPHGLCPRGSQSCLWGLSGHCRPPNSPGPRTLSLSPFTLRRTAFAAPARRNLPARRSGSQGGAWLLALWPRGSRARDGQGRPRTAGGFRLPSAAVGLSPRDPQHQGFAMHRPPRAIAEGNNGTLGTVDSQEEETQGAGDLRGALLRGARRTRPPRPHAPRARPSHPPRPRAALPAREQKLPGGSRHPPAPTLPPRPPPLQLSRAPGAAKQRRFCDRVTAKWCDIRGGRRSSSRGGRALPGPSATTGRGSARRHRIAPRPSARRDPHER